MEGAFFAQDQYSEGGQHTIESRYGNLRVNLDNAIFFPKGLLGLPDFRDFCLAELPNSKTPALKLMQSLNDKDLSFIVLPAGAENKFIDAQDMHECYTATGVAKENILLLFILTIQNVPGNVKVTANIRAPIVVDTAEKLAIQYVFPNNKYDIRHILS
jgi:flagellar assembly factor FliW